MINEELKGRLVSVKLLKESKDFQVALLNIFFVIALRLPIETTKALESSLGYPL